VASKNKHPKITLILEKYDFTRGACKIDQTLIIVVNMNSVLFLLIKRDCAFQVTIFPLSVFSVKKDNMLSVSLSTLSPSDKIHVLL
jgi:hypothetical protein